MKLIPLTQGYSAKVDNKDYNNLMEHKWYAQLCMGRYYAARNVRVEGKHSLVLMHREIMNTPDNLDVDHINHDELDNQRHNLRNCTTSNNQTNRIPSGKSKYKGVIVYQIRGKYTYIKAAIVINKITIHLGNTPTEEQAAKRYDMTAKYFYGEFAYLNFG